ncbi:MAG: glycosyltransferase family 2 protein [Lachnospiraceae bacterium]|nr:glycosyltransferase family 2 protein [Lachnospiraceae bacterium]
MDEINRYGSMDENEIGNAYYQAAYAYFEEERYENAVENFIKAYTCGIHREEILENLYNCFILPNEMEFKKNYEENKRGFLDLSYEQLEIDFIPVSDLKFYLFHRPSREFLGCFQLDDTSIMTDDVDFESILIADCWDFRQMLPSMKEKTWEAVYILLNDQETKFASFFKLPCFRELYMGNVIIFKNTDIMERVFEKDSDIYLPKRILSPSDNYDPILNKLHQKRIADLDQKRRAVFLSILIPSYNRGAKALAAVQEICRTNYDSEIEIVVSDNGSVLGAQEYQKIRDMQDSRVRYYRNEENLGFLENFIRVLELAKGEYAILSADEDLMLPENLSYYLSLIKKNKDCGVFLTSGISGNFGFSEKETVRLQGIDGISSGISKNYMTGAGYHMELIRQLGITEFLRSHKDNLMVGLYPHCVINFKLVLVSNILQCGQPPLWLAEEAEEIDGIDEKDIKPYMTMDSREKQCADMIEIFVEEGVHDSLLCYLCGERFWKFLWLLYIAIDGFPDYYRERGITWEDMLEEAAGRYKKNISRLEDRITVEEREMILKNVDEIYQNIKENGFA